MNTKYQVAVVMHGPEREHIVIHYDDDRESAIAFIRKYDKENGFSISLLKRGRIAVANIVLIERSEAGETVSETPFIELFDKKE